MRSSFLSACLIVLSFSSLSIQAAVSIDRMRCEYLANPLGIDVAQPRLDWLIVSSGATPRDLTQKSYRVLVASSPELLAHNKGDLWDSGEVASDETNQIAYAGQPLQSRKRCCWKVRVTCSDDESFWSKPACWEMGLPLKGDLTRSPTHPLHSSIEVGSGDYAFAAVLEQ